VSHPDLVITLGDESWPALFMSFYCKRGYAAATDSLGAHSFNILREYASGLRTSECPFRFSSTRFRDEPS
ncbi:MAG: hypothetical protein ACREIM_06125, partial [Nitrospiraceae bacterium]